MANLNQSFTLSLQKLLGIIIDTTFMFVCFLIVSALFQLCIEASVALSFPRMATFCR